MDDELAAKLAAADRGEPPAPPGAPVGRAAPAVDEYAVWGEAVREWLVTARPMLPENAQRAWTDPAIDNLGARVVALARKYQWKFGALFTDERALAAIAAFPLVWPLAEPYLRRLLAKPTPPAEKVIPPEGEPTPPRPRTVAPVA